MMTHGLRSVHDAILVGAGTVRQDNPRLNVRHWPPAQKDPTDSSEFAVATTSTSGDLTQEGGRLDSSPQVVFLANKLNDFPQDLRVRRAIVFTPCNSAEESRCTGGRCEGGGEGSMLSGTRHTVVYCKAGEDGRCDLEDCLSKLYSMGFKSLMVEGGASVITSFLRAKGGSNSVGGGYSLVDRVIVTVAPVFQNGYNVLSGGDSVGGFPVSLGGVTCTRLGDDLVIIGKPRG
ncbi:unnamed protein product [Choristocarpus tenellus]